MVDIGGIIERLTPLIKERAIEECNLWVNSRIEAANLLSNLKEIQNVLEEAERRRLADPRVRNWLQRLRDVMYEIDDALDEWEAANHRLQFLDNTWWKMISFLIRPLASCIDYFSSGRGIALHIKELNREVEIISKETAKYNMLPINNDSLDVKCEITTSFSDLIEIRVQQKDKERLVDAFSYVGDIGVISLVGMAGLGKTTVAKLAFCEVQSEFDVNAWICIPHKSDMAWVTKAILRSLDVSYPEDADLERLLKLVQWAVRETKFLLVLDQVWIEDDSIWNQLKTSLWCGAPGSRIIVTSRNENVKKLMGSFEITLSPLCDEDCWLLFSEIAFRGRTGKEKEKLEGIGRIIAKKCGGLPLAAKTLGYHLQSRISKELWDDVLEKELWQLDEVAEVLFAPFALSYNELPLAIKHCFSYCAIFPDDINLIDVDELIRLWMVRGYLSSGAADIETELRGCDYFEKLARSSFFQDVMTDGLEENVTGCKIHIVLLNFARYLAKTGSKAEELRTFYVAGGPLLAIEVSSMKSVRVLILPRTRMTELPEETGKLIHLRYIVLSETPIEQIPRSIGDLYNLQCLDLRCCEQLSKLPEEISKLRNLRHLLVNKSKLRLLPQGLEKLTNLRTLDEFHVGRELNKFGYLANLNQLRGFMLIYIGNLIEKEDIEDAKKANLRSKIYISALQLVFQGEVIMDVMKALQAPPNLRYFHICNYGLTNFPRWIELFAQTPPVLCLIGKNPPVLFLLATIPPVLFSQCIAGPCTRCV